MERGPCHSYICFPDTCGIYGRLTARQVLGQALSPTSHLIPTTVMCFSYCFHPHFADEETKVKKGLSDLPLVHNNSGAGIPSWPVFVEPTSAAIPVTALVGGLCSGHIGG